MKFRKFSVISAILLLFALSSLLGLTATYAASSISIVKTIPVGSGHVGGYGEPQFLIYNPSNKFVYVSDYGYYCSYDNGGCSSQLSRSNVVIITSGTNKVVARVPVGYGASDIIYNPSNNEVYVVNQLNNTVSVLNGVSVVKTISVGAQVEIFFG